MKLNPRLTEAPTPLGEYLLEVYQRLYQRYGPQRWWPGDGPFETILGAILTQNTSWGNVERALGNLKAAQAMSPQRLRELPMDVLANLIRPSGYFNTKARKLKAFVHHLDEPFHPPVAEAPPSALRRRELPPDVPGGPGAGGEDHLELGVVGHLGELLELLVAEEGGAHHCGDEPVDGDVALVHLVDEGVEHRQPLDSRDLDSVVGPVGERQGGSREIQEVAVGESDLSQHFGRFSDHENPI